MRLIDADDFFSRIENDTDLCAEMETDGLKALKKYLDMQSTAYDIDKVVEELEQKKEEVQRMRNTCVALSDLEVCDIENVTYERAIEIVKHGGIGKVVKQMDEEDFHYCHNDDTDEYHDCLDYMECEECPYYYADLDQESD